MIRAVGQEVVEGVLEAAGLGQGHRARARHRRVDRSVEHERPHPVRMRLRRSYHRGASRTSTRRTTGAGSPGTEHAVVRGSARRPRSRRATGDRRSAPRTVAPRPVIGHGVNTSSLLRPRYGSSKNSVEEGVEAVGAQDRPALPDAAWIERHQVEPVAQGSGSNDAAWHRKSIAGTPGPRVHHQRADTLGRCPGPAPAHRQTEGRLRAAAASTRHGRAWLHSSRAAALHVSWVTWRRSTAR